MRLISTILFFAISILLFFFFIDPLYGEIKELRANVSTYNTALNNSTELQKTRDDLVDTYKQVKEEDRNKLVHLLPSTINNIELILEIEKIANLHGMPIGEIKFDSSNLATNKDNKKTEGAPVVESNPSEYLPYGIFPMEFTIEGRYETFLSFLKDLESNLRLVDVKSINFTVPEKASGEGSTPGSRATDPTIYRYSLKVETYWLK